MSDEQPTERRRSGGLLLLLLLLLILLLVCLTPVLARLGGPIGGLFQPINRFVGPVIGPVLEPLFPGQEGKTCECGGDTLYCEDGFEMAGFPGCTNWPEEDCACQGLDLICDNGTSYKNFEGCGGTPAEVGCSCDDGILYCDDGAEYGTADKPFEGCGPDSQQSCQCDQGVLYCVNGSSFTGIASCGEPPSTEVSCECDGGILYCDDGTQYGSEDKPFEGCPAGSDQTCTCDDGVLYCNDGNTFAGIASCGQPPEDRVTPVPGGGDQGGQQPTCDLPKTCGDGKCDPACEGATNCPADCQPGGGEQTDPCAEHGGIQYQGEVCTCEGKVDKVTVCEDGTKFDVITDETCEPDPKDCQGDEGGDEGGGQQCQLTLRDCVAQGFTGLDKDKCQCTGKNP